MATLQVTVFQLLLFLNLYYVNSVTDQEFKHDLGDDSEGVKHDLGVDTEGNYGNEKYYQQPDAYNDQGYLKQRNAYDDQGDLQQRSGYDDESNAQQRDDGNKAQQRGYFHSILKNIAGEGVHALNSTTNAIVNFADGLVQNSTSTYAHGASILSKPLKLVSNVVGLVHNTGNLVYDITKTGVTFTNDTLSYLGRIRNQILQNVYDLRYDNSILRQTYTPPDTSLIPQLDGLNVVINNYLDVYPADYIVDVLLNHLPTYLRTAQLGAFLIKIVREAILRGGIYDWSAMLRDITTRQTISIDISGYTIIQINDPIDRWSEYINLLIFRSNIPMDSILSAIFVMVPKYKQNEHYKNTIKFVCSQVKSQGLQLNWKAVLQAILANTLTEVNADFSDYTMQSIQLERIRWSEQIHYQIATTGPGGESFVLNELMSKLPKEMRTPKMEDTLLHVILIAGQHRRPLDWVKILTDLQNRYSDIPVSPYPKRRRPLLTVSFNIVPKVTGLAHHTHSIQGHRGPIQTEPLNLVPNYVDVEPNTDNLVPNYVDVEPNTDSIQGHRGPIQTEPLKLLPKYDDVEPNTGNIQGHRGPKQPIQTEPLKLLPKYDDVEPNTGSIQGHRVPIQPLQTEPLKLLPKYDDVEPNTDSIQGQRGPIQPIQTEPLKLAPKDNDVEPNIGSLVHNITKSSVSLVANVIRSLLGIPSKILKHVYDLRYDNSILLQKNTTPDTTPIPELDTVNVQINNYLHVYPTDYIIQVLLNHLPVHLRTSAMRVFLIKIVKEAKKRGEIYDWTAILRDITLRKTINIDVTGHKIIKMKDPIDRWSEYINLLIYRSNIPMDSILSAIYAMLPKDKQNEYYKNTIKFISSQVKSQGLQLNWKAVLQAILENTLTNVNEDFSDYTMQSILQARIKWNEHIHKLIFNMDPDSESLVLNELMSKLPKEMQTHEMNEPLHRVYSIAQRYRRPLDWFKILMDMQNHYIKADERENRNVIHNISIEDSEEEQKSSIINYHKTVNISDIPDLATLPLNIILQLILNNIPAYKQTPDVVYLINKFYEVGKKQNEPINWQMFINDINNGKLPSDTNEYFEKEPKSNNNDPTEDKSKENPEDSCVPKGNNKPSSRTMKDWEPAPLISWETHVEKYPTENYPQRYDKGIQHPVPGLAWTIFKQPSKPLHNTYEINIGKKPIENNPQSDETHVEKYPTENYPQRYDKEIQHPVPGLAWTIFKQPSKPVHNTYEINFGKKPIENNPQSDETHVEKYSTENYPQRYDKGIQHPVPGLSWTIFKQPSKPVHNTYEIKFEKQPIENNPRRDETNSAKQPMENNPQRNDSVTTRPTYPKLKNIECLKRKLSATCINFDCFLKKYAEDPEDNKYLIEILNKVLDECAKEANSSRHENAYLFQTK